MKPNEATLYQLAPIEILENCWPEHRMSRRQWKRAISQKENKSKHMFTHPYVKSIAFAHEVLN